MYTKPKRFEKNELLQLDLRELFLPSSRANTPIFFFLKHRVTIKYFKHWLILTAKGLLQSSEFHGSPISREPDIIQVSWRRKGENKDHLLFHQITQISSQWSANKRLGEKKSLVYAPVLERWNSVNVGKEKKMSFCSLTIRKAKFFEERQWHNLQGAYVILVPKRE